MYGVLKGWYHAGTSLSIRRAVMSATICPSSSVLQTMTSCCQVYSSLSVLRVDTCQGSACEEDEYSVQGLKWAAHCRMEPFCSIHHCRGQQRSQEVKVLR